MSHVLPRVLNALAGLPHDLVLLLDDFHLVDDPRCHDQVEFLIEHLPAQAHLVISTRTDPGLRLGRLRASGRLAEVRADQLGFTREEASAVLTTRGVHLPDESIGRLVERTEGWPAAIYLATLSMADRADPVGFVERFSGDDLLISDYLVQEVLSRHSEELRDFMLTISVLGRFTPELCDAVTQRPGSARILHTLERTNLLLVPLVSHGPDGPWFRFHHLFASVTRNELELAHPDQLQQLHARAAAWFGQHGHVDEAFWHSLEAGDTRGAARLAQANWVTYVDAGRLATVEAWLDALGPADAATDPAAVVIAAWMAALRGDGAAVAEHVRSLAGVLDHGPLPDGSHSVESAVAILHGVFGYEGRRQVVDGGRRAAELETDGRSPQYSFAAMAAGHADYLEGDLRSASGWLTQASQHASAWVIISVISGAIASLVEAELGHSRRSRELAELAMGRVETHGLGAIPQSSLAYTAMGRVQAADGDTATAMATLDHGLALRRLNSALGPWSTIHHLMVMAPVAAEADQTALANSLLDELTGLLDRYDPEPGPMRERLREVRRSVGRRRPVRAAGEPLSSREMDVLRLLRGPLSLPEMARELYLSSNTVKTHSKAIYHKLGAHSREEAVEIARRTGLI